MIRKTKVGTVVGRQMKKTAVVEVKRMVPHGAFKKYVRRAKTFKVHDPEEECRVGDQVLIVETRPLSRTKSWKLAKILRREEELAA